MHLYIIYPHFERTHLPGSYFQDSKHILFTQHILTEYKNTVFFFRMKHSLRSQIEVCIRIENQNIKNTSIETKDNKQVFTLSQDSLTEIRNRITAVQNTMSDDCFDFEDSVVFDGYEYRIFFSDSTDAYYCTVDNFSYHLSAGHKNIRQLTTLLQDIFRVLEQNGVDKNLLQLK